MAEDKQIILDLEEQQIQAFNQGDVKQLLTFFDEDLTGFSSTQHMRLASLGELKKTFEYYLTQAKSIRYSISDPCVKVVGDTGILTFYWAVHFQDGAKKKKPIKGRGTHVYMKRGGKWIIVHEHFSRAHGSLPI